MDQFNRFISVGHNPSQGNLANGRHRGIDLQQKCMCHQKGNNGKLRRRRVFVCYVFFYICFTSSLAIAFLLISGLPLNNRVCLTLLVSLLVSLLTLSLVYAGCLYHIMPEGVYHITPQCGRCFTLSKESKKRFLCKLIFIIFVICNLPKGY